MIFSEILYFSLKVIIRQWQQVCRGTMTTTPDDTRINQCQKHGYGCPCQAARDAATERAAGAALGRKVWVPRGVYLIVRCTDYDAVDPIEHYVEVTHLVSGVVYNEGATIDDRHGGRPTLGAGVSYNQGIVGVLTVRISNDLYIGVPASQLQRYTCAVCDDAKDLRRCVRCMAVVYCGSEHQRQDWQRHKSEERCERFERQRTVRIVDRRTKQLIRIFGEFPRGDWATKE